MKIREAVDQLVARIGETSGHNVWLMIQLIGLERAEAIHNKLVAEGNLGPSAFAQRARAGAGPAVLNYPYGSDYAWHAVDADGHIAAFAIFETGPMPLAILEHWEAEQTLEDALLAALPSREHEAPSAEKPGFMNQTSRGIFLYDWGHFGRNGSRRDQYAREPVPPDPVTVDQLPETLAQRVRRVQFTDFCFADYAHIDLHQLPPYAPAIPADDLDL